MFNKTNGLASIAFLVMSFATNAFAATQDINTGTPVGGNGHFPYAFDSNDFYAGQVTFSQSTEINSILTYLEGGTAGETFTVSLYNNSSSSLLGNQLYSTKATYSTDGWNGLSNLTGWNVNAATYWVAFEILGGDDLGAGTDTGALLTSGAPSPLSKTAFNSGSGYGLSSKPMSFGLQVTTPTPVPLPPTFTLMLASLGFLGFVVRRRKTF